MGKVQPATTPRGTKNPAAERVADSKRKSTMATKEVDASFERCKDAAVEPKKRTTHLSHTVPPLHRTYNPFVEHHVRQTRRRGSTSTDTIRMAVAPSTSQNSSTCSAI